MKSSNKDKMKYFPRKKTRLLIPDIERMYYNEKLSMTRIANALNLSYETVEKVIVYLLHGKRERSDVAKYVFNNLSEVQKSNMVEQATKKRLSSEDYIKKLSLTKLGIKNPQSKLNEEKVILIRRIYQDMLEQGYMKTQSQIVLAQKFGVKRPTISDIVLRRSWKHLK
ncbi:hypothetical protein RVS70_05375 [Virgibacillus sp. M23]|uniref:hypothetical protein n=1 Tax=Virgibacillus sp. M23 TaxID=3079030 RepID=UPI002A91DCA4|nr:hypothetical protein [Virgibacillus sp. M23]MDY7043632.1 hypothetical protein [Virgibacillus sp. M23]